MIKPIVAIKRLPDMSPEAFHEHWPTRHTDLVKKDPAAKKYIRKYVQCHTLPDEYRQGPLACDGTAELWFDSIAAKDAFFSNPDYLEHIRPDESRFADMTQTVFFVAGEESIIADQSAQQPHR